MCDLFANNADYSIASAVVVPINTDLIWNMINVGSDALTLNVLTGQITVNKRGTYYVQVEVPYDAASNPVHLALMLNNAVSVFDVMVSAGSQLVFRTLIPLEKGSVLSVRNLSVAPTTLVLTPRIVISRLA